MFKILNVLIKNENRRYAAPAVKGLQIIILDVDLRPAQRLRRLANIRPALVQRLSAEYKDV